jgi:hypothetical protein
MPQVGERIVNAAGRCFARYGVGKTTVEAITAVAFVRGAPQVTALPTPGAAVPSWRPATSSAYLLPALAESN